MATWGKRRSESTNTRFDRCCVHSTRYFPRTIYAGRRWVSQEHQETGARRTGMRVYKSKARVLRPRTLNANTALLKSTGAKYFDDLFSPAAIPSPALMINVKTTDSVFDGLELDDYGYESDSDLEDEDDGTSVKSDTELASSFTGRYPAVLELELDLLAEEIVSAPIVEGLPHLMRRIAQKELSHGADILIGYNTRILRKHYLSTRPTPAARHPPSSRESIPLQLKTSNSVTISEWSPEEFADRISDKEDQSCPSSPSSTQAVTSRSYGSGALTKTANVSNQKKKKKR
ncbi:hypothetical protein M404DRAFT_11332 [Pisolithus tinctorius Marx 270]|uniref:Uncharacterized protein n=1 Tax=Pisolithus tinctorius Marx 270 TaxID=870435 RepID=A0A0C3NF16_PISTI|nr:hypothetical protein M404DRAFT_11332 [Pisolithus tinctorius Marx 270]